ncbi:MAG: hypothetical protein ILO10_05150, partial [Kiritimatiellae bacterium]|nr:hypothetical protein [Kiritimatiellia bacterium]
MLPSDELAPDPANAPEAIAPAPNAPAVTDDDVSGPAGDAFSITFGLPSPPAPRPYSFRPDFRVLADHQVWDAAATAATKLIPWPRRAPPSVLHLDWLAPPPP